MFDFDRLARPTMFPRGGSKRTANCGKLPGRDSAARICTRHKWKIVLTI